MRLNPLCHPHLSSSQARAAAIEVAAGSTTAPPASPAGGWVRFLKPFADAGEATGDSDDAAGVRAAAAVLDASLTSLRSIPGDLCLRGALEEATKAANLLDRLNEISRGPHESTSHLNFSPFGPCNPAGRVIGGRRDQYLVQEMVSTALRNVTGVMLQRRRGSSSAGGGAGTGAGAGAGGGSASGGRAAKNPREPTPGSYFGISTSAAADGAPSPEHLWKAAKSALWSLAAIGTLSGLKTTDMCAAFLCFPRKHSTITYRTLRGFTPPHQCACILRMPPIIAESRSRLLHLLPGPSQDRAAERHGGLGVPTMAEEPVRVPSVAGSRCASSTHSVVEIILSLSWPPARAVPVP